MSSDRKPRADALRNRERLLDAARRAFTTGSPSVSLEGIARDAGVGIGTLYRHFPTRDALVAAVYQDDVARVCAAAGQLLATEPPDVALRRWMTRFAERIATKQDMAAALRGIMAAGAISVSTTREQLSTALRPVLQAGVDAGLLRDDIAAEDVVVALVGLCIACPMPEQRDRAERLFDVFTAGLRT